MLFEYICDSNIQKRSALKGMKGSVLASDIWGSNPKLTIFAKNSQKKMKFLSNLTSNALVPQNRSFTEGVFYHQ